MYSYLRWQVFLGWVVGLLMPWQLWFGSRDIREASSCPVCDHPMICPQQVSLWFLLGLVTLVGTFDPALAQSTHQLDNSAQRSMPQHKLACNISSSNNLYSAIVYFLLLIRGPSVLTHSSMSGCSCHTYYVCTVPECNLQHV